MKAGAIAASTALCLSGCATYGDTPNHTITVNGNYQFLADCYYEKTANPRGFQKVDLASLKTSRITAGSPDMTVFRIDFIGVDETRTEVRAFTSGQAFGEYNWNVGVQPAVRACVESAGLAQRS